MHDTLSRYLREADPNSKAFWLDFSAGKEGPLVAYRWDGEAELSSAKMVSVH